MAYPPTHPFNAGLLSVADGHLLGNIGQPRWETCALSAWWPGSGLGTGGYCRHFDPQKYRIVGIDQRGCGRSHPLATDALGELYRNPTLSLIEAVRTYLGIETWLVSGVSWGTTLALGQGLGAGTGRGNDDQP